MRERTYLRTVDSFNLVAMGLDKCWIIFSHPKHFSIHLIQIQSPRSWRQNVCPKHWNLNIVLHVLNIALHVLNIVLHVLNVALHVLNIVLHVLKTQKTNLINTHYENLTTYVKGCWLFSDWHSFITVWYIGNWTW